MSSSALVEDKAWWYSFFAIQVGFVVGVFVGHLGPKVAKGVGRAVGAVGSFCRAGIGWGTKCCARKARRAWHLSPKRRRLKGNDGSPIHEGPALK